MNADILIVDDSVILRKVMRKAICQLGVDTGTIQEAGDGAEALKMLESNHFDLILLDMHMPVMGGHEFALAKAADPKISSIPFVVVSTEANAKRLMEMVELGALGVLRKPFEPEDLRRMVSDYLPAGIMDEDDAGAEQGAAELPPLNPTDLQNLMSASLERAAFVLTDPAEVNANDKFDQHAHIGYTSEEEEADIFLSTTEGFLREFTASLLGVEEDSPGLETDMCSAIAELANILAGEIVLQLGGEDTRFVLGVPESCGLEMIPSEGVSTCAGVESMGEAIQVSVFRRSA